MLPLREILIWLRRRILSLGESEMREMGAYDNGLRVRSIQGTMGEATVMFLSSLKSDPFLSLEKIFSTFLLGKVN